MKKKPEAKPPPQEGETEFQKFEELARKLVRTRKDSVLKPSTKRPSPLR